MKEKVEDIAPRVIKEIAVRAGKYLGLIESVVLKVENDPIKFPKLENACESGSNIIYINENWLREMFRNNTFTEFRRLLYHEFRHQYQIQEVIKMKSGLPTNESIQTLKSWEQEISNPIRNNNDENTKRYYLQSVEIDAEAFALHLLDQDAESGFNVQLIHNVPKEAVEPIKKRKRDIDRFYE